MKVRGFKMALLNVVSLPKHLEELTILLREKQFDLLALNETQQNSTIPNPTHIPQANFTVCL